MMIQRIGWAGYPPFLPDVIRFEDVQLRISARGMTDR